MRILSTRNLVYEDDTRRLRVRASDLPSNSTFRPFDGVDLLGVYVQSAQSGSVILFVETDREGDDRLLRPSGCYPHSAADLTLVVSEG